jgi:hypothetical protein
VTVGVPDANLHQLHTPCCRARPSGAVGRGARCEHHAELLTISGGPHDPWNYQRWFPLIMERAIAFLKGYRSFGT